MNGRPGIYFSPADLSTGMVGTPVDGVVGYSPATSIELVRRIILSTIPPVK